MPNVLLIRKAVRHEPKGQSEYNPQSNKTVRGGQWQPSGGMGRKIELTVDVEEAWKSEAKDTYLNPQYGLMAVRELIQNAVDACKMASRRGQPGGEVTLKIDPAEQTIRCRDTGIGMDIDTLLDKFLKLKASGKRGEPGFTGGFGVAKAVILGCSRSWDWSIHSRDCKITSAQLGSDIGPQNEAPMIQGTEFTIRDVIGSGYFPDQSWRSSITTDMADILRYSDPGSVPVSMTISGYGTVRANSGFDGKRRKMLFEELDWPEGTKCKTYSISSPDSDKIIVRLNGLVQYIKPIFSNPRMGKAIVFDLTTTEIPGSPRYPFNKGRDGVKYDVENVMDAVVSHLQQENVSGGEKEEFTDEIFHGGDDEDVEVDNIFEPVRMTRSQWNELQDSPGRTSGGPVPYGAKARLVEITDEPQSDPDEYNEPGTAGEGGYSTSAHGGGSAAASAAPVQPQSFGDRMTEFVQRQVAAGSGTKTTSSDDVSGAEIKAIVEPLAKNLSTLMGGLSWKVPKASWMLRRNNLTYGARKKFSMVDNVRLLTAWDTITHFLAASYHKDTGQSVCSTRFGTGFILDNDLGNGETAAQATQSPGKPPYLLLNPTSSGLIEAVKLAQKGKPQRLKAKLYNMSCHELTHLPRIGQGHDQQYAYAREDLAEATDYLGPTIEKIIDACFNTKAQAVEESDVARAMGETKSRINAASGSGSRYSVDMKRLLADGVIVAGQILRFDIDKHGPHDSSYRARVLEDGQIQLDDGWNMGGAKGTLSAIGMKVSGWKACNGWDHWSIYDTHTGEDMLLGDIRKRHLAKVERE